MNSSKYNTIFSGCKPSIDPIKCLIADIFHLNTPLFIHLQTQYLLIFTIWKEKLRSKILARLNEGGSNADEPTNIKLSDYSSDEGDTSNSGSDNEYNTFDLDAEGFCCQSVPMVPPPSPVTSTKSMHRKVKVSNRPSLGALRKTNQYHRSAIDLPTSEPFLEFQTSDFDDSTDSRLCTAKQPVWQQARIDPSARGQREKGTPDELIITSAKQYETITRCDATDNKEKCNLSMVAELPGIRNSKRFNSAWSSMKSIRIKNLNYQQTVESLKVKLTLKKQMWNGGSSSTDNEADKANQPLAWGISVINRRKSHKPDSNEELLAECSQKLLQWKKDENKRKKRAKKQQQRNVTIPRIVITNEKAIAIEKCASRKKLPALNRSSSESPHNFTAIAAKSKALLRSQTEIISLPTSKPRTKTANKFKAGAIVASTYPKSTKKHYGCKSIESDTADKTGTIDMNESTLCGRITLRKIKSKFRKKTKRSVDSLLSVASSLQPSV